MSVELFLPPSMQGLVNGVRQISTEGNTLGDCLEQAVQQFPQLKEVLFGASRTLNKKLSFYVNTENAHPQMLQKATRDGDKLYIMDILVGG